MPARESVLPPSVEAAPARSADREPLIPADWPGTWVPNFSDWRLGDIVLVRAGEDLFGPALRVAQQASFSPLARRGCSWTHAAIYVGAGDVVDASFGRGVVRQSVWNYCQTRALRVRRLPLPLGTPEAREAAVEAALGRVGRPYSTPEVVRSKLVPRTSPLEHTFYCSTFVALCWADATGFALWQGWAHRPLYPAVLAEHELLDDVALAWMPF